MATHSSADVGCVAALTDFTQSFVKTKCTRPGEPYSAPSLSALQHLLPALRVHFSPDSRRPFIERLAAWLATWPGLPPVPMPDLPPVVSVEALQRFLGKIEAPLAALRATGVFANVWVAAGLRRDEKRNAQVLAWFLDRNGDHGQGPHILQELINVLDQRFPSGFPRAAHFRGPYHTQVESCPDGGLTNRVDIEIAGADGLLFLELKIDAPEGADQLTRYCQMARSKAGDRPWGVLYVTPTGKRLEETGVVDDEHLHHLLEIGWADVARGLRSSADTLPAERQLVRHYLKQFAAHIDTF